MDFGSVKVVGHEANYHERLFLEAWFRQGTRSLEMTTSPSQRSTSPWHAHKSRATFFQETARGYFFPKRALGVLLFESRVLTLFFN